MGSPWFANLREACPAAPGWQTPAAISALEKSPFGDADIAVISAPPSVSEEVIESNFDVTACLERVRAGDESAARTLVEQLYPLVIKIVRGHLPRRLDEEDLAQEIFMKLFAKLEDYRGSAPFEHWASRIARNTCLNQLRAEKARPELRCADLSDEQVAVLDALAEAGAGSHPLEAAAADEMVGKLLECLGPQDRMIIQMLELDDLSVNEISRRTGWSATVIRVRAFRARRKLRHSLTSLQEYRSRI